MTPSRLGAVLLVAAFALTLAPTASAHTTVDTDDGRFFITAGNQNEPILTYTKTGLDLIVRENVSGERGDEVPDLHRTLEVTLIAPNGDQMTMDLKTQFREVGRYEFVEPYVLTQPGEYFAQVTGEIDGTPVDQRILLGSGPVPAYDDLTFPHDVQTLQGLQERIAQLETEVTALQDEVDAMKKAQADAGANEASAPGPVALGVVALAAVLLTRRLRG